MAGEKIGSAFEVLTYLALVENGYIDGKTLHWEASPKELSVRPDFILGDLLQPVALLLLTNTGSASNSHMKFWRNVGEMFEAKMAYGKGLSVINLVFQDQQMIGFREATEFLADVDLRIQNEPFGESLISMISNIVSNLPEEKDGKIMAIKNAISTNKKWRNSFSEYKKCLLVAVGSVDVSLSSLWTMAKSDQVIKNRASKATFLKRGVAKLMFLTSLGRDEQSLSLVAKNKHLPPSAAFAVRLGWANSTLRGIIVNDPEVLWVCHNYESDYLLRILNKVRSVNEPIWEGWHSDISGSQIPGYHKFVCDHYDELVKPNLMLRHLTTCSITGRNWLFFHLMETIKSNTGMRQGYGFSVLASDVGYDEGINRGYKVLADWANGSLTSKLPPKMLRDVSTALAFRLSEIPKRTLRFLGDTIEGLSARNIFEYKVVCYEKLEPLLWLIEEALIASKINYSLVRKQPSFIGEALGTPNLKTTPVLRVGRSLIHWKSAYDQGRSHKVKELSGRAPSLKYSWSANDLFGKREKVSKLILVLDGTWRVSDLEVLYKSGWDEIFYPDEMDRLAKAIV